MIEVIKTYISKKLIDIRDLVKDINLTYVYEKAIDYHTIIVEPTYTYENNPLFHSLEKDLIEEIGKKFGIYDILFTQAVPYISINEKEVVLRLTSINTTEDSETRFSYLFKQDIQITNRFNEISKNDYTELISSYALAA